jgi:hypothetical protein
MIHRSTTFQIEDFDIHASYVGKRCHSTKSRSTIDNGEVVEKVSNGKILIGGNNPNVQLQLD